MIVGGIEEIRIDEPNNDIYVADSYLGGRVMVFDFKTLAFKRGWGAYGRPLSEVTTNDADRAYAPGGPMPKEFRGHLTINVSNDGLVYAADRNANRIHVTTREGKFLKEFKQRTYRRRWGDWRCGVLTGQAAAIPLHLGSDEQPHLLPRPRDRQGSRPLGSMGESGGSFWGLHMIAVDSKGNIYTGEVFAGQRIQRFVPADSPRGKVLEQLSRTGL